MSAPAFLVQATEQWARLYGNSHAVSNAVVFLHFAGLLLGGGAAVAADRATLLAAREDDAGRTAYLPKLARVHRIVIGGLALTAVSGLLMFLSDVETFWDARVFWVKMGLVVLMLANGAFIRRAEGRAAGPFTSAWRQLQGGSVLSIFLWFTILLASVILASS